MSQKLNLWLKLSPLLLALIMTLVIVFGLKFLPNKLPLFYSLSWGEAQLASHQEFLIIPASIVLITLLNFAVSWQLHPSQSFFKKVLLFSPIIISLILSITFIKIVLNFI